MNSTEQLQKQLGEMMEQAVIQQVNQFRKTFEAMEQHKFDVFDYDRLEAFSDTALAGLNRKCRHYNLPTPDLGVMVKCSQKLVSIDLAWPRRKVAVLINPEDQSLLQSAGWTVFTLGAAMKQFEVFQNKVR